MKKKNTRTSWKAEAERWRNYKDAAVEGERHAIRQLNEAKELLESAKSLADDVWRGRFADLPARLVGHHAIGNIGGTREVADLEQILSKTGHRLAENIEEFLGR